MPLSQSQKARPCSQPVDAVELRRRLEKLLKSSQAAGSSSDAESVQLEGTKTAVEKRLQRVSMTAGSLITTTAPHHPSEASITTAAVAEAKLSRAIRVTDLAKSKNTSKRVGSESAAKTSNGGRTKTDRVSVDAKESSKRRSQSMGNEKPNENKGNDVHELGRHGPAKEPGRKSSTATNVKREETTRGLYAGTAPQPSKPRRSNSLEAVKEEQELDSIRSRPALASAPATSTESYLRAIQKRTSSEKYSKHRRPAGAKMRTTSSDENLRGPAPAVGETWRAFVAAQIAKDPKSDPRRQHPSRRDRDLSGRKPRPNSTADLDAWFADIKGDQENSPPPRPKRATIDRPDWSQSDAKEKRSSFRFLDPVFRRSSRKSNNMEPVAAAKDKNAKRRTVCGGESLSPKKSLATVDIKVTSPTGRRGGRKLSTADGTGDFKSLKSFCPGLPPRSPPPKSPKRFSQASSPAYHPGLQVGSRPIEPPPKSPRRMHSLSTTTSSQASRASSPVFEVAPLRTKLDSATSLAPPSDPDPSQFSSAPKSFRANRASKLGLEPPQITAPEPVLVAREEALAALEGKIPTPKRASDDTDDEDEEPTVEQKPEQEVVKPDSGAATNAPCLSSLFPVPPTPPPPPNPTINIQRASIPLQEQSSPPPAHQHFLRPSTRSSTRSSRLSLRSKASLKSVKIAPDATNTGSSSRSSSRSRSVSRSNRSTRSRLSLRSRGVEKGKAVVAAALELDSASGAAERARAVSRKGSGSMRARAAAGIKEKMDKHREQQQSQAERGWVRVGRMGDADKDKDNFFNREHEDGGETPGSSSIGATARRWSALVWRGFRFDRNGGERNGSNAERDDFSSSPITDMDRLQVPTIPIPRDTAKPLLPLPPDSPSFAPPSLGRVDEEDDVVLPSTTLVAPPPVKVPASTAAATAASLVPSPAPATTATAFTTNTPPARSHGRLSLGFFQGLRSWRS